MMMANQPHVLVIFTLLFHKKEAILITKKGTIAASNSSSSNSSKQHNTISHFAWVIFETDNLIFARTTTATSLAKFQKYTHIMMEPAALIMHFHSVQ